MYLIPNEHNQQNYEAKIGYLNVLKYLSHVYSFGFDKAPLQFAIVGFLMKNSTKETELKLSKLFSNFKKTKINIM